MNQKILFICGSLNQTRMMHSISKSLDENICSFTPYYADGIENLAVKARLLEATILGSKHRRSTLAYLEKYHLSIDLRGENNDYDLVVTCSDLIIQRNIRGKRLILVQEGITEPKNLFFYFSKYLKTPRYFANTATSGLSDAYDIFCVASTGYRDHFINNGVKAEKIIVTGIPNFDHFNQFQKNDFPRRGFVLVATTPLRESFRFDDRKRFIRQCVRIAGSKSLIFKLHPMEKVNRAVKEIKGIAPGAQVLIKGNVEHMIANAEVVITQQSTCTFVAVGLGKKVHTYLDIDELKRLMPIQNHGTSARRIAGICTKMLRTPLPVLKKIRSGLHARPWWEAE